MSQPNDFNLDIATRIAVHEILLQKLFAEYISRQPDPDQTLAGLVKGLDGSFDLAALSHGLENPTEYQTAWLKAQSSYGKELSLNFCEKLLAQLKSQGR